MYVVGLTLESVEFHLPVFLPLLQFCKVLLQNACILSILWYSRLSSVKRRVVEDTLSGMDTISGISFMYRRKRRGSEVRTLWNARCDRGWLWCTAFDKDFLAMVTDRNSLSTSAGHFGCRRDPTWWRGICGEPCLSFTEVKEHCIYLVLVISWRQCLVW